MSKKNSWREKLADSKDLPRVGEITGKMTKRWGPGTMVISAPWEVDAIMEKVPRGKLVTINVIRQALAKKHGTTIACPIATGMFAWIAADAACEGHEPTRSRSALIDDFSLGRSSCLPGGCLRTVRSGNRTVFGRSNAGNRRGDPPRDKDNSSRVRSVRITIRSTMLTDTKVEQPQASNTTKRSSSAPIDRSSSL